MASHTAILADHQVAQGAWAARAACVLPVWHRVVIRTVNRAADITGQSPRGSPGGHGLVIRPVNRHGNLPCLTSLVNGTCDSPGNSHVSDEGDSQYESLHHAVHGADQQANHQAILARSLTC